MKKYIIILLTAAVFFASVCIPSSALTGKWNGISWNIVGHTLLVSGGAIPDCTASHAAPWQKFAERISVVVIDNSVTAIGARAFEDMTGVTEFLFGKPVSIGELAFSGCSSLKSVILPDSVTNIGRAAFAECTSLGSVSIPASVNFIGDSVWEYCPSLREIIVSGDSPSSVYYSDDGVLFNRSQGRQILRYPPARPDTSYKVPSGITSIADGAFCDASRLTYVDLGGVNRIGNGAFFGCSSLESITMESLKSVGRASFFGCFSIYDISFPESLTFIGPNAFSECRLLTVAEFRGNAPITGGGIFDGCSPGLTLLIGEQSTGFGDGATWLGCPLLRHGGFSGSFENISWRFDSHTGTLEISGGEIPDFESPADAPWYVYRKITKSLSLNGVTRIGKNNFRYSSIRSVELPDEVESVGDWAFSGCTRLQNVTANSLKSARACAFFGDTALEIVKMKKIEYIGDQCFSGCDILRWIATGNSAPSLGKFPFDGTSVAVLYPKGGTGYDEPDFSNIYTENYTAGDANGDGVFTSDDVIFILRYLAGWNLTICRVSADVDGVWGINSSDVLLMLRHLAGWDADIGFEI